MTSPWSAPPVRVAAAAVIIAAALCGAAVRRAVRLDPLPAPDTSAPLDEVPRVMARTAYPPEVLLLAVERDPFSPSRRAPGQRFRLPAEVAAAASDSLRAAGTPSAPAAYAPPAAPVQLLGTMLVAGGTASAICQVAGEPARLVHVGERIGDYTLARVEAGRAVLVSRSGVRTELTVARPSS